MTKQEFLNGTPFTLGTSRGKGESTYYFIPGETSEGCICKQIRSDVDGRAILDDYHLSVDKVGTKAFTGFVFIMNKRINVRYKYEDLTAYVGKINDENPLTKIPGFLGTENG
jgi:hypothetical protein